MFLLCVPASYSTLDKWVAQEFYIVSLFFWTNWLCNTFIYSQLKNKFIKKIPKDAEASNVLVGEVDFLDKPFVAFVRLLQSTMLGGVTEVPVPTR